MKAGSALRPVYQTIKNINPRQIKTMHIAEPILSPKIGLRTEFENL